MTIIEFLLARIAEDEAMAKDVAYYTAPHGVIEIHLSRREGNESHSKFVHPYDPTRVLAECEAKRAIVGEWSDNDGNNDMLRYAFGDVSLAEAGGEKAMHWRVLRHLALPYADHADYDEGWLLSRSGGKV